MSSIYHAMLIFRDFDLQFEKSVVKTWLIIGVLRTKNTDRNETNSGLPSSAISGADLISPFPSALSSFWLSKNDCWLFLKEREFFCIISYSWPLLLNILDKA